MRRNATNSAIDHMFKPLERCSTHDFLILKASIKLYLRPAMYSKHFSDFQDLLHWNLAFLLPLQHQSKMEINGIQSKHLATHNTTRWWVRDTAVRGNVQASTRSISLSDTERTRGQSG